MSRDIVSRGAAAGGALLTESGGGLNEVPS
jgi:hypothetical protein